MTRIGNDTKAPQTKSTAGNDGAREATTTSTTTTTGAEDVPTLDELDAGMSLERSSGSYESTELQSVSGHTGVTPTGDGGMSSVEGMTPIEETPLAKDIAAVEQQCITEVQGHAFELRTLGIEVGGDDGTCLEQASDALMTSSEAAGEALPGSALPVLAEGVTAAGKQVDGVADDEVGTKARGFLDKAWSGVKDAAARVEGMIEAVRPEPAPGQTHEVGIRGTVGIGVASGEGKDLLSIGRERNADGSGGDYLVAREVTVAGSLGVEGKIGAKGEVPGKTASVSAEVSAGKKLEGSVRVEYRAASLEQAHDRLDDIVKQKALSVASSVVPGIGTALGTLVELGGTDIRGASALTVSGGSAIEAGLKLGVLKGGANKADSVALKLDIEKGAAKRGELSSTTKLEASVAASFLPKLGAKGEGGISELKAGSVAASITTRTRFELGDDAARVTGKDIVATLEINVEGRLLKAQVTVPPGKDADEILFMLEHGQSEAALARVLDANGIFQLEGGERAELGLGGEVALAAKLGLRGHYAVQSGRVLEQKKGRTGDLLREGLATHGRALLGHDADLQQQMSAHQQYR